MNLTQILIFPAFVVLATMLIEKSVRKVEHSPWFYIRIFLAILVVKVLIHGSVFAYDFQRDRDELNTYINTEMLTQAQESQIVKKIREHKKEGKRHFKIAEETIPIFPSQDDQDLIEHFFTTAIVACTQGTCWSVCVASISTSCIKYSLDVYKEWKKLGKHLKMSQHHFEMMEWYQHVLSEG